MSLLTSTAHTPERIFGLLKLLNMLGGESQRDIVQSIMDPDASEETAFIQTIGAAASLNIIEVDRTVLRSLIPTTPSSHADFSDLCYDRLLETANSGNSDVGEDSNALLYGAYAMVAFKSDQNRSLSWFCDDMDLDAFATEVRMAVAASDATGALFNKTKLAPWRRWMYNLGLIEEFDRNVFIPDVSRRLTAEISRSHLPKAGTQSALQFLGWVRTRMPFLPGGNLFASVTGQRPRLAECGVLLSAALRNLRDEGVLRLSTVGDAAGQVTLSQDVADPIRSFSEISFTDRIAP